MVNENRQNTAQAVACADAAWARAPMHVKAMAGAYVGPLLAAMQAMNKELQQLQTAAGAVSSVVSKE